jgi:hypothetical protein
MPERLEQNLARMRAEIAEPYVGVTTDGAPRPGLFTLAETGVSTGPILDAANRLLAALAPEQVQTATFPLESDAWRSWSNISPFLMRHGLCLETLTPDLRALALEIVRASLSAAGYQTARDVMRLNHTIGELTGYWDEYGEWVYWLSIMGTPSATEPWGWQLDGHHLIVNCFVLGDQVVMTPCFMGSEPTFADGGEFAGTRVFEREEAQGFELMRALSPEQQRAATVGMQLPFDVLATAPHDNLVLPADGIRFSALSTGQQSLLLQLIETYTGRIRPGHAEITLTDVKRHLAETVFAWIGPCDEQRPFYYRVYSPVILIEFDHQRGIAFDHDEPARHHIHTVVRTPNGNDYGKDLLRQHYAQAAHHRR